MGKTAIVAGSTGLVGNQLLKQLLANGNFSKVITVVRKPTGIAHPALQESIVDFDRIENYAHLLKGDVFFSCLGSTKAKTPDKKQYYKIDHDYPLSMAKLCLANEVGQCHLISAIGAKASSNNFYLKMKGEIEQQVANLPFESVHIYRPSLLTGDRKEQRTMEKIATNLFKIINPIMLGSLRKYRSIDVADVAKAMVHQSLQNLTGIHCYESDEIQRIADSSQR